MPSEAYKISRDHNEEAENCKASDGTTPIVNLILSHQNSHYRMEYSAETEPCIKNQVEEY
ncbi:MAG TPA: hypothetical protein DDZ73_10750 [Gammaproteobacteria bacterium]|nr:MAG: hypothetical protein COA89_00885 [Acidithiobacillus sp.]HAD35408.1 hypothetical protein [Gammaproteobacteria bacterium]HBK76845.1 hypothetical protein [Gammaproteobacteria bacterium]